MSHPFNVHIRNDITKNQQQLSYLSQVLPQAHLNKANLYAPVAYL